MWPGRNGVQVTCNTSSAYHVQVSCYLPLGTKGQLSYSVWQSWNRIYLSFILLAEPLNRWRRGGNRSTRRKPLTTSFRKYHILQPKDSSPKQNLNWRSSIGGRRGRHANRYTTRRPSSIYSSRRNRRNRSLVKEGTEREERGLFCLLDAYRPSNRRLYLRDGSAQTILRAATLR